MVQDWIISPRSATSNGCLLSPCFFNTHTHTQKIIQIGKEEIKLSLLSDDMIICTENPKEYTFQTPRIITGNQWSCRIQVKTKNHCISIY